jgi:hypothetical protein
MTALEELRAKVSVLERAMDPVIEQANGDLWAQTQADWAWYRLSCANVLVRDEGGGALAAALARGLLEQAAYWDWAIATGVNEEHVVRRAAVEYQRLKQLAAEIDDCTWLGWVLPPGVSLVTATDQGVPPSAADAVRRLGSGLAEPVLQALQFRGLFSANRLLDILTHGNLAAALVMAPGGGQELPTPLAAAVLHVAAAGATATVLATLAPPEVIAIELTTLATEIATLASAIHGLELGPPEVARQPARAPDGHLVAVHSDIDRMPAAAESTTAAALRFYAGAKSVVDHAIGHLREADPLAALAWSTFQLAWAQMLVLEGVITGQLGRALLPIAARGLFEDGARWGWLRQEVMRNPTGNGLRAIVGDSKRRVQRVRDGWLSEGVPKSLIDDLLGPAVELLKATPDYFPLPSLAEMLRLAYPTSSGVESARPMYSLLSQFVHATPFSALHLERDTFPSLTAPMYAVAVEAACRGFFNIARSTLYIACEDNASLGRSLGDLARKLSDVIYDASRWHVLG